ncbi:MAG: hypothetical protein RR280_01325 [Bacteroidaceae bacterium]
MAIAKGKTGATTTTKVAAKTTPRPTKAKPQAEKSEVVEEVVTTTTVTKTTKKVATPKAEKKVPATKKTTTPKIGEELVATEEQVIIAQSIAQLQAEVNDSGVLEKLAEIDELKKALIGQFHGTELQDLTLTLQDGTVFKISKPATTSTIDREKIKKYLGNANFMKLATVSVTDAKKYLTPEQQNDAIKTTSGSRKLSIKYPDAEE